MSPNSNQPNNRSNNQPHNNDIENLLTRISSSTVSPFSNSNKRYTGTYDPLNVQNENSPTIPNTTTPVKPTRMIIDPPLPSMQQVQHTNRPLLYQKISKLNYSLQKKERIIAKQMAKIVEQEKIHLSRLRNFFEFMSKVTYLCYFSKELCHFFVGNSFGSNQSFCVLKQNLLHLLNHHVSSQQYFLTN